jgi:hypothetical protein
MHRPHDFPTPNRSAALAQLQPVDRPPMSDNEANALLAAFNHGKTTVEGRLWS